MVRLGCRLWPRRNTSDARPGMPSSRQSRLPSGFTGYRILNCTGAIRSLWMTSDTMQVPDMPTPRQMQQPQPQLPRTTDTRPQMRVRSWFDGAIRGFGTLAILIGPALTVSALAGPPPGSLGQLQQLNRESEATLGSIQRPSVLPPTVKHQANRQKSLDRWQRAELQRLQEGQRRELLLLNHRARTRNIPGPPPSLQGINKRSRFQRQQQYQLNRFRLRR